MKGIKFYSILRSPHHETQTSQGADDRKCARVL